MKYYNLKPAVLCVTARNKVLKSNIPGGFPENWWEEGKADKLVEEGFLIVVGGEDEKESSVLPFNKMGREKLMEILTERGVNFETDANKTTLYKLYSE